MLSPIQNINFKRIFATNKITKQNNQPKTTEKLTTNPLNQGYYVPFLGQYSFQKTLDENYFQLPKITFEDGSYYQLRPDNVQLECAKKLYKGDSVVFCAPTGTGKTAVAHYIMTKNFNEDEKTYYTSPLKALANDKYREFKKVYGDENVGLLTGDIKINTNAPIQIMTTEIYNILASNMEDGQKPPATVIFDEAHYLKDKERGNVWENSIINTPPNSTQILCLSATIGNSEEFTSWIQKLNPSREVSIVELPSENRHVPLLWHVHELDPKTKKGKFTPIVNAKVDLGQIDVENLTQKQKRALEILFKAENNITQYYEMTKDEYRKTAHGFVSSMQDMVQGNINNQNFEGILGQIYPELSKTQRKEITQFLSDETTKQVQKIHTQHHEDDYPALVEDLRKSDKLPALIFKLSRNACFNVSMSLKENRVDLTTDDEKEQIQAIMNKYKENDLYTGASFDKDMLLAGYAYHHAGELPQYRKLVEELFAKKLLKVVVATSTLSAGINMPARSVVISDTAYKKYNPLTKQIEYNYLDASTFHQMAGRAGRRGIDTLGHVILYNLRTPWEGFKTDILTKLEKGNASKAKKDFDKMPDELGLAYELIEANADNLVSHYKPDWCILAQYFEKNTTNEKLQTLINSSFKVHSSKNPNRDSSSLLNKFIAYENVLLKEGFLEKNKKGEMSLTPKGKILKMCQGVSPLALASLIYDEKLEGLMMEDLCQIIGYINGSTNQKEEDGLDEVVEERMKEIFGETAYENDIQEQFAKIRGIYKGIENPILRHQKEARISPEEIVMSDSFSGFATYLFSRLNISNNKKGDSVNNFRKITGTMPTGAIKQNKFKIDFAQEEFNRKSNEGSVYKLIAQTISTFKQIDRICEYALSNPHLYPNQDYYKNLQENSIIALELLEQTPFNDEMAV